MNPRVASAPLLALSAMAMAGMMPSYRRPVRQRDSRSDEENARRLEAAEAKRARRAAKARN